MMKDNMSGWRFRPLYIRWWNNQQNRRDKLQVWSETEHIHLSLTGKYISGN
jgi:hypothetical protein